MTDEARTLSGGGANQAGAPAATLKSAVSGATGLVGLCGLAVALVIIVTTGMKSSEGALLCLAGVAVPMILWTTLVARLSQPDGRNGFREPPAPRRNLRDHARQAGRPVGDRDLADHRRVLCPHPPLRGAALQLLFRPAARRGDPAVPAVDPVRLPGRSLHAEPARQPVAGGPVVPEAGAPIGRW